MIHAESACRLYRGRDLYTRSVTTVYNIILIRIPLRTYVSCFRELCQLEYNSVAILSLFLLKISTRVRRGRGIPPLWFRLNADVLRPDQVQAYCHRIYFYYTHLLRFFFFKESNDDDNDRR